MALGWMTLVKLLLPLITKKKNLSFAEAELLGTLVGGITGLFERAKRTCVHKTHECTYRDGACYVLSTKGEDWTMGDIESCPYRKLIGKDQK